MKYPGRCNRRCCQSRRNLSKKPEEYRKPPKCHICKIGFMYVDWYRFNKGAKDRPPICKDNNCRYQHKNKKSRLHAHNINNVKCSQYAKYRKMIFKRGHVKNSPFPKDDDLYNIPF